MSNIEKVLGYLEDECGGLSPLEALNKGMGMRLAAVVCELRKQGYDIKTTMEEDKKGHRYARYYLLTGYRIQCPECDYVFDEGEAADRFKYGDQYIVECPICGHRFDAYNIGDEPSYEEVCAEWESDYWKTRL